MTIASFGDDFIQLTINGVSLIIYINFEIFY